jgi:hypothetical protein
MRQVVSDIGYKSGRKDKDIKSEQQINLIFGMHHII